MSAWLGSVPLFECGLSAFGQLRMHCTMLRGTFGAGVKGCAPIIWSRSPFKTAALQGGAGKYLA